MNIKTIIVLFFLLTLMSCSTTPTQTQEEQDTGTFRVQEARASVLK